MIALRPEALAVIARWWGVAAGVMLAALGLRWGLVAFGILQWLGWALVPLGIALAVAAAQKARFGAGGGGAGVVTVDEGRIAYFGPTDGGIVALDDITRLLLDRSQIPDRWRIEQPGQSPLLIPTDAEGAGALFDAFVALPGLSVQTLLAALRGPSGQMQVIWQRDAARAPRLTSVPSDRPHQRRH